jgi:hypothetical protein
VFDGHFRFACLFSGFIPTIIGGEDSSAGKAEASKGLTLPGMPVYDAQGTFAEIPSLHSYGASDEIICPAQSIKLASLFGSTNKTTIEHSGGHGVPVGAANKKIFKEFILEQCNLPQKNAYCEAKGGACDTE